MPAIAAVTAGEADAATSAEVPAIQACLSRPDLRIVATLSVSRNANRIVARRDHGIQGPADLRGKHIATQRGTARHLFLHLFLMKNQMADQDVKLSSIEGAELLQALSSGTIDAASLREPLTGQALELLGTNAVSLEAPGLYIRTEQLVVSRRLLQERPAVVRALLRALLKADAFASRDRTTAIRCVAAMLGQAPERIAAAWADLDPQVALDQALLGRLDHEAQWMLAEKEGAGKQMPNFLEIVDPQPLAALKPEAVTLIR